MSLRMLEKYFSTAVQFSEQFAPKIKKLSSLLKKRLPMFKKLTSQAHDWSFLPNGAPSPPIATLNVKGLPNQSGRIQLTGEGTLGDCGRTH